MKKQLLLADSSELALSLHHGVELGGAGEHRRSDVDQRGVGRVGPVPECQVPDAVWR
ncbi:hypothetical protein ABZW03_04290 [Kitasatospora sp. NPDC004799]|uniref:hypothetical protein n=1 Tax=Kitasatospora sp. NPDC004799 TaxID=3154460 RepID=UPI0033B5D254